MTYLATNIANAFIKRAQENKISGLTPMKLQKLMFFAQSWYIKKYKNILFPDMFWRWDYGPVIPSIYQEFKSYGSGEIKQMAKDALGNDIAYELALNDNEFLDEVVAEYGKFSAAQLSWMTHQAGTAWSMGEVGTMITPQELFDGRV